MIVFLKCGDAMITTRLEFGGSAKTGAGAMRALNQLRNNIPLSER